MFFFFLKERMGRDDEDSKKMFFLAEKIFCSEFWGERREKKAVGRGRENFGEKKG